MAAPTLAQFSSFIQCAPWYLASSYLAFFCEIPPLFCAVSAHSLLRRSAVSPPSLFCGTFTHKGSALFCGLRDMLSLARKLHCVSRCPFSCCSLQDGARQDVLLSSTCPGVNFRVRLFWVSTRGRASSALQMLQ